MKTVQPKYRKKQRRKLNWSRDFILRIRERELANPDGTEKGWVHQVMLAWQRHYLKVARAKKVIRMKSRNVPLG